MTEQDQKDLKEVQEIVREHPILKKFLMHRLGNLMCSVKNYIDLMEFPETTDAQRQKYIANAQLGCENLMAFLRECVGIPDQEFKV